MVTNSIHEKRIEKIMKATGWDRDKAISEMNRAAELGIPNGKYVLHEAWIFSHEELLELKIILDIQKENLAESLCWHANVVREKSGMPYEKALELLKIAKKKGYSYKLFVTHALWKKTEEEIIALPKYTNEVSEDKEKDLNERKQKAKEYRELIMEEMGWTLSRARLETFRAQVMCGCTGIEFYLFGIYKNGIEAGKKYITSVYNARMKTRYCDWGGEYLQSFINKGQFNKEFKDFVKRRWLLSSASFEEFKSLFTDVPKIIYKPADGLEGRDIKIFELTGAEEQLQEIYSILREEPEGVVEEFVTQHPEISKIYPNAVNTIRVMSFLHNGEGKVLNAVMKFAINSNVDNYYQGSLAVGVDTETGCLCTDGVDYSGNIYEKHPYSGTVLKGFRVPHWDKLLETIREAAKLHPEQPYIGWDVAITPDGPEIIEGNNRQGAYLIQYPFAVCNHEGRRYTIEQYLSF